MANRTGPQTSSITDVTVFFNTLTDGYVQLTRSSNTLKSQLDILTPQVIQSECEKLALHRNELNLLDDQLIDILDLTGADSSLSGLIDNYSIALMKARIACD
ncbi:MAG: hypothetical protein GY799_23250, partial [Desulfobulbaceae bacterium]|nr:hypothetical protein [Desulfobulbaceae bacterium]